MNEAPTLRNPTPDRHSAENRARYFWQSRMSTGKAAEPIRLADLNDLARKIRRAA